MKTRDSNTKGTRGAAKGRRSGASSVAAMRRGVAPSRWPLAAGVMVVVVFAVVMIVVSDCRMFAMSGVGLFDVTVFRRLENCPLGCVAPQIKSRRTEHESGTDAEDGQISGGLILAISTRPLEVKHLSDEARQRQQPSRS